MSDLELVGPLYQYECHTCRHMSDCYDTADPDRCCPACGHTEVTTHLRGGCANVGCRSCPPLHLLRVCEWWRYDGCRQTDCTWPSCAVLDKGEPEPCA